MGRCAAAGISSYRTSTPATCTVPGVGCRV
jgi:hypothetical protein